MVLAEQLERGRRSFAGRAWADAYAAFEAAGVDAGGSAADLVAMGTAALLVGEDDTGCDLLGRAHQRYLADGDLEQAARCAFFAALNLAHRGRDAVSAGWLGRAAHLADTAPPDALVHGYLRVPAARAALAAGRLEEAEALFREALDVALRVHDGDLAAFARIGLGEAAILDGHADAGRAQLDDVMVAVTTGEVGELTAGVAYCQVISLCRQAFDVRRAREWTSALIQWCDGQPDLVPFHGECLVHRSEVLLEHDDWDVALDVADRAVARLAEQRDTALGMAVYQKGEVHRLRGEHDAAEAAFRRAHQLGREPEPGRALLLLARGRVDGAADAVRRALRDARSPLARCPLLPAAVEVLVAAHDLPGARAALADLDAAVAALGGGTWVAAVAAQGHGRVALAEGRPADAREALRAAWRLWQDLDVPYEAARTRVLLAAADRALGDADGERLELDAARWAFAGLGAAHDLELVDARLHPAAHQGPLTAREVEVLRLVATGMTNRAVAGRLVLSEKTVARHVSNILAKLDVPSRAAATAYAYEHDLV